MKNIDIDKCPLCGNELYNGLCKTCGYLKIFFPEIVPESIKQIEASRLTVTKKLLNNKDSLEKANDEYKKQISNLNQDLLRNNEQLEQAKKENSLLKYKISSLEKANKESNSQLLSNDRELKLQISDLKSQLTRKKSEVQTLTLELQDTQKQISESLTVPNIALKGIVMIEDIRNDIRSYLPVFEGVNSYGSNPNKWLHHNIKIKIRGFEFNPIHFFVKTSEKGLILEVLNDTEILHNGKSICGQVYARQSDSFYINDKIRINICQM